MEEIEEGELSSGEELESDDEEDDDYELEEETFTTDSAEKPEPVMDPGQKALNDLLAGGARFLMGLSQALAPQKPVSSADSEAKTEHPLESIMRNFIGKDEASGKPCLKIPIPEPEVVNSIVSGLQQLFRNYSGMK
jgi:hypothetical protein